MMENRRLGLEEILKRGSILESKDKTVRIYGLVNDNRKTDVSAYVESETSHGSFYSVKIEVEPRIKHLIYGSCTCESFEYHGNPCKHMLKLRNVFQRNIDKLDRR